ncbi:MAG: hypothetical protein RIQ93_3203 [Verrucomicrobiota bacterium]
MPIYVLDDSSEGGWRLGAASRWWLHHSLAALMAALRERGSQLILARGESGAALREAARGCGADAIFWNRRYEPAIVARDAKLKQAFVEEGFEAKSFNASLLHEPHAITNKQGRPFQVFTPYWRHCLTLPVTLPAKSAGQALTAPARWPKAADLAEYELLPRINWAGGFTSWLPGEKGAQTRLRDFIAQAIDAYADHRNLPDRPGTSMISPHLHFGEIGPRQIWAAVQSLSRTTGVFPSSKGAGIFLNEIGWREFAHHLLFHFPRTPDEPLRAEFARFPWASDPGGVKLRAWQTGRTGYPLVDAGLRQLWTTGWMHNRVRMVVASFLVKHLRLPWNLGAAWFWDTLVDADLANNTLGWQWSAGCGADAAPYFRIFAPVLQGKKFDPDGSYVRRWVPELSRLPAEHIHAPWEAPAGVLAAAGVRLGKDYPGPVVDHARARGEALAALKQLRQDHA